MNFIDNVHAHIYRWYQKMAENGRKVNPKRLTSLVFGICGNGWFIFFTQLYYHFLPSQRVKIDILLYGIVGLLSAGVANLIYSHNDMYLQVYNHYLQTDKMQDRKRAIIYSWIFIFFPYMLLLLFLF